MNEIKLDEDLEINFDDIDFDIFEEKRYNVLKVKRQNSKNVNFKYAKDFANEIVITKGCRYFSYIDGSFIFGDFIEAFLIDNDIAAEITLSTLSLSQENIDSFANLLNNGYITKLNIIVSDYFFAHEKNYLVRYMYKVLDIEDKFQLAVCRTHTKTTLIKYDDKNITISGSANLRSSDNLEQISIEENEELYNFNFKIHNNIITEFKTINKSIKTKKLWKVVRNSTQK